MADSGGGGGGGGGGCGRCCCSFILTSGLTALFMWLSLRTSNPVCSIQDIYVPALNKSANSTEATTNIYFNLKLDNENKDKGIYYDALNLTFFYAPNKSLPIGNRTFPQFYQGHKKNTRRTGWVETRGVPWEAIQNGSTVSFRVDLATAVRFKIMAWKTKKHKLVVGADVEVNDHGKKVHNKGIRLRSGAPERGCYRARMWTLVTLIAVYYLVFLN